MPQSDAGIRIEPPVSEPSAPTQSLAATAAPEPPLEPPGTCAVFHGLRVAPKCGFWVVTPKACSCRFVLPMMIAPAALRRATTVASALALRLETAFAPQVVSVPARWMMSLTAIGIPRSSPGFLPLIAFARCMLSSRNSEIKALSCGSQRSIWENVACINSVGEMSLRVSSAMDWVRMSFPVLCTVLWYHFSVSLILT